VLSFLVQHEWMLIELLVLGLALDELWSINRQTGNRQTGNRQTGRDRAARGEKPGSES
jgi:hypothetical protein